ncbi:hypothetical protein BsWGS_25976 [Bradybaena similaris]
MMCKYVVFVICAVIYADSCAANAQSEGFVGFSVSLDQIKSITNGQTVKYTNVIANAGNHYNIATGVFTAPRTAYYLFHIHAVSNGHTGFWFQLMHNEIPRINCHGNPQNYWTMGGNSVLLEVKAGERVYVKGFQETSHVYGSGTEHYATFTGHQAGV